MGKFLLCRVRADPYLMEAMHFLVEDEDGEVEKLAIHNYTTSYETDPADVFPENTVIAIKEPYLKIMIDKKNRHLIHVDSPTVVVVLDDYSHSVIKWMTPMSRSLDQINDTGNLFYVAKKYRQAIKEYTQALKVR